MFSGGPYPAGCEAVAAAQLAFDMLAAALLGLTRLSELGARA
jgi:hypothetical protein